MKSMTLIVSGVFLVAGCASQEQNAAAGAAIGGAAGCFLANAMGKNCAEGLVLGAAVGAAFGWASYSEKVATAQAVNAEARKEGLRVPVNEIILKSYKVHASPALARAGGEPLKVTGDIKLYGQSTKVPQVVQKMTLVDAKGEELGTQNARVDSVDGAGHYTAIGKYTFPKGMPQGQYMIKNALFLDGKNVAGRDVKIQVAYLDGGEEMRFAALE